MTGARLATAVAVLLGLGVPAARWSGSVGASRPAPWPHEPPTFDVVSDQPWSRVPSLGWDTIWGPSQVVADPSAPGSPPDVLQITYPAGFPGGSAPGTVIHELPDLRQVYAGLWWHAPADWQGHESNVNKIAFLFPAEGGDITLVLYGPPAGPFTLRVLPQFEGAPSDWLVPTLDPTPVALGEWHRIEWLVVPSSRAGIPDGIVRWWLDGRPQGSYAQLLLTARSFTEFKLSPTWGGVGDRKRVTESFRFDHIRLSGR